MISKWFREGTYKPYSDEVLQELILAVKAKVHPWIRLNRVIRDIPNQYIMGGNSVTNLRQVLQQKLKERGQACKCIRCRELKGRTVEEVKLVQRSYRSSGGREIFLSYETPDEAIICGFLRLRVSSNAGLGGQIPELVGAALVRELHVYGKLRPVARRRRRSRSQRDNKQHTGLGRRLMHKAEQIAREAHCSKVAVIAGIGTREYYRHLGFELRGTYMVKDIGKASWPTAAMNICLVALVVTAVFLGPAIGLQA